MVRNGAGRWSDPVRLPSKPGGGPGVSWPLSGQSTLQEPALGARATSATTPLFPHERSQGVTRVPSAASRHCPPAAGGALRQVLELARQLCEPLAFLHGAGLVHRDLKPTNILVRSNGQPVLVDFGATTTFPGPVGREALVNASTRLGTVSYMAPEQVGLDEDEMMEAMRELLSRQVVEEHGAEEVSFVHDKIREAAYERLSEERKAAIHRSLAAIMESEVEGGKEHPLPQLAQHWERAGAPDRAAACYLAAAREQVGRYGAGDAEQLYRAYVRLAPASTLRVHAVKRRSPSSSVWATSAGRESH